MFWSFVQSCFFFEFYYYPVHNLLLNNFLLLPAFYEAYCKCILLCIFFYSGWIFQVFFINNIFEFKLKHPIIVLRLKKISKFFEIALLKMINVVVCILLLFFKTVKIKCILKCNFSQKICTHMSNQYYEWKIDILL